MDCNNCAQSIHRYLERQGLEDVLVNFQTREVRYRQPARGQGGADAGAIRTGIEKLGYTVVGEESGTDSSATNAWMNPKRRLLICTAFTLPLLLGHLLMMVGIHVPGMHLGWVQFALALPVYLIGGLHFGRSAISGLRTGMLNMDVLIFLGATAAFVYSCVGLVLVEPRYYFFETAATIITLVLVGNWLEARAVERTTTAIAALSDLQEPTAQVVMPSGTVVSLPVDQVKIGTRVRANTGDRIPLDGTVEKGSITVNEAMLTGESLPVEKQSGDEVLGGSSVVSGSMVYSVSRPHDAGTLSRIIELVKTAQADKPEVQRLADRISAVFVPVVVVISMLTFLIGWLTGYASATQALMNAIAVLLISCPCAMGLATPTAVMVGVGRLARAGILIRGGSTVEELAAVERVVFDKTGTLTTGDLSVATIQYHPDADPRLVNRLIYEMESHSSHPIARSVRAYLEDSGQMAEAKANAYLQFSGEEPVVETAGLGLHRGNFYLGKPRSGEIAADVVLYRGGDALAWLTLGDELRPSATATLRDLRQAGIETVLLTGDREVKAQSVARQLDIDRVYASHTPSEKLERITALSDERPTAMVGDGINDAAALSRAGVGVSLGGASAAALDAARVVLMRDDLSLLTEARRIARLTVRTIRESLFWAFSYNVVAIPLAALGYLNPLWAALFMAFSDVVVIGNAIRLKRR
jgi:Cu+-exporting ATPase